MIKNTLLLAFPLVLLALLILFFINFGPLNSIAAGFPPIEKISFERIVFEEDVIKVHVLNDGPDAVTISQVLINDAYTAFSIEPKNTLEHLESAVIIVNYHWVFAEPVKITLLTSDGLTFEKEVGVPFISPTINTDLILSFALIGLFVGVIPVFIGLLWLPFLKTLHQKWYHFFLSLTAGLLLFLAVDSLEGAFGLLEAVPSSYQGTALILIGFLSSLLLLLLISKKGMANVLEKEQENRMLLLSYMIALAIGIHNLGEGLAIGSAYSIGEISLGTLLVIGFMVHNVTEGVAIAAPLTKYKNNIKNLYGNLLVMCLLAGIPTIVGTWIGGFSYSPTLALIFLSIGSAAAFQVVINIINHMKGEAGEESLFNLTNSAGVIIGLLIMYITGFFVV